MAGAIQPSQDDPWAPAGDVAEALGMSMALFGMPGCGKTSFCAEPDSLIIDLEGGAEVVADRKDVSVWPKKDPKTGKVPTPTWDSLDALLHRLETKPHPFKIIAFDTMSKMQKLALKKVMKASPTPDMPSQPEYGKANTLVADVIEKWCGIARETGVTVVFNCHAEEVPDDNNILIRMSLTPGVTKTMYQAVSAIGYLAENVKTQQRKLLLRSTNKINAKFRQPQSGPQLPLEISDPSLATILEHRENARKERNNA